MRRILKILGCCVCLALLLWVASELFPRELHIVHPVSDTPPPWSLDATSVIGLQAAIDVRDLEKFVNSAIPETHSQRENDPTDALTDDYLDIKCTRRQIILSTDPDNAIHVECKVAGSLTVKGIFGTPRRNKGPLGWFEKATSVSVPQSGDYEGTAHGAINPIIASDWSVDPKLSFDLDVTKADSKILNLIKFTFRSYLRNMVLSRANEFIDQLKLSLQQDLVLKKLMHQLWEQANTVRKLQESPNIWLRTTPMSISIASPFVQDGRLNFPMRAKALTEVIVSELRPELSSAPFPEILGVDIESDTFDITVPVSIQLNEVMRGSKSTIALSGRFGDIILENIRLSGHNNALMLTADMKARPGILGWTVTGRVAFVGDPVIDFDGGSLYIKNLQYSLETRSALTQTANWLLQPIITEEIQKHATFQFAMDRADVLRQANSNLQGMISRLPDGINANLHIDTVDIMDISVTQGWIVLFPRASGRLSLTLDASGELMERAQAIREKLQRFSK